MNAHRIFAMPFAKVYPLYIQKAERKNRSKEEVDQVICWLTGYSPAALAQQIEAQTDFETFFAQAPAMIRTLRLSKASYAAFGWKKSKTH
jgi:hypothetical protein